MSGAQTQVSLNQMGDIDGKVSIITCGACDSTVFSLLANGGVFCAQCKIMAFGLSVLTNKVKQ